MKNVLDIHNKGDLISIGKSSENNDIKGIELVENSDIYLDLDSTIGKGIDYQIFLLINELGWREACWIEDEYIDAQFHTAARGSTPSQNFQCKKEDGVYWDFRVKMNDWSPAIFDFSNDGEAVSMFRKLSNSGSTTAKTKGLLVGQSNPDEGDILFDLDLESSEDINIYNLINTLGWSEVYE